MTIEFKLRIYFIKDGKKSAFLAIFYRIVIGAVVKSLMSTYKLIPSMRLSFSLRMKWKKPKSLSKKYNSLYD
ncbi:hypothetical protein [Bartonella harrusi]|uniref:Uncharacterized protein n=1 Tax=Bartonella harrusi TaxID=2961895 RepID=A0ABY5EVR9_9HYPH|nr:hypothetical protein [Bartonella harrusi]UTO29190.1 hypothetical protein NMK50_04460 [Bartonella harrusi]